MHLVWNKFDAKIQDDEQVNRLLTTLQIQIHETQTTTLHHASFGRSGQLAKGAGPTRFR